MHDDGSVEAVQTRLDTFQRLLAELDAMRREASANSVLAAIVESSEDAVIGTTTDGVITSWNDAAERMYGFSAEEAIGRSIALLHPAGLPDALPGLLRRLHLGEHIPRHETVRVRKDGVPVEVALSISPIRSASGDVVGIASIARDVTGRKRAERALEESERRYRLLFEQMSEAFALGEALSDDTGKPRDFRFLDVNPGFERMTGLTRDRVLGKTLLEVLPGTGRDWLDAYGQVVVTGKPRGFEAYAGTLNKYFQVLAFAPSPGQLATLVFDISERKKVEIALAESEARFRRIAESAQDIILRVELFPEIHYGFVSPAVTEVLGYAPEEFYRDAGLRHRVVHPDDLPWLRDLAAKHVPGRVVTFRCLHRDGRIVWLEQRNVAIHDAEGRVVAYDGILRDVTERKLMEERLLRAERLETAGRVAGQVSHDFNNLLGPLVALPELIRNRVPHDQTIAEYCDVMVQAARRMADINADLLALGRRGNLERQPIDLNQLVREAVRQTAAVPEGLRLDLRLDRDLMPVRGAGSQLLRVLHNLIANAREATQDAGTITIRTENVYLDSPVSRYNRVEVGEYARLIVADTGCGIPPGIGDRVFDAFFSTKHDRQRGSGLGLTIVQSIVADHQGYIDLESEQGKGTIFSVYFPVSRGEPRLEEKADVRGGTETVLVVDDDAVQRRVLKEVLESLRYHVRTASSGEEALRVLRERSVSLLVLDMVMPNGIDGTETYRRALEANPRLRAVILSGYAESARVAEAKSLGAGTFLPKPVNLEALATAVRDELDRRA